MSSDDKPRLTAVLSRFVDEYLVDGNGTKAAIRAGYSARSARQAASKNLKRPEVQAAIAGRRNTPAAAARTARDAPPDDRDLRDRLIATLENLAFSNVEDYLDEHGCLIIPWSKLPRHVKRSIAEITIEDRAAGAGADDPAGPRIRIKPVRALDAIKLLAKFCNPQSPTGKKARAVLASYGDKPDSSGETWADILDGPPQKLN